MGCLNQHGGVKRGVELMNRVFKIYALTFALVSLLFMSLVFYGEYLDGTYYFYEYNKNLALFELIVTISAIPFILILLKEAIWDYGF